MLFRCTSEWPLLHSCKAPLLLGRSCSSASNRPPLALTRSNPLLDLSNHPTELPPSNCLLLYPDFISTETHEALVSAADRKLRRLCGKAYWKTHHDGVINNYREASVSAWGTLAGPGTDEEALPRSIVERIKRQVETETGGDPIDWLDPHILDLAAGGDIRAHVDNLQASGSIITGLCLMSPAVAVFRSAKDPNVRFSAWLEPRTLYVQRDDLRFVYTHEILATLPWRGSTPKEVRGRRMSLMMRNAK